jgi:cytosol alanyl aminopeptidase
MRIIAYKLVIIAFFLSHHLGAKPTPSGQLPTDVEPLHYQLEIKLNPEKSRFSGNTQIKIKTTKQLQSFYLHAQNISISDTRLTTKDNQLIKASTSLTEVDGVIKVTSNQMLKPGVYDVNFTYDAPFNENLEGL